MKAILYNNDNNQFCVIFPNYSECLNDQEKENILQTVINKDLPKKSDGSLPIYFVKDYSEIEDRRFIKPAWKLNDQTGEIYFDKDIAKEIKKNHFRFLRKPLLEKLDIEFMKAFEINNTQELLNVATKKQVLRDITNIDMSQYQTPQDLHNFIPDVLKSTV